MIYLLLAQVFPADIPTPTTRYEFWAVIFILAIQTLLQWRQSMQTSRTEKNVSIIQKQTNGLVEEKVNAARDQARFETIWNATEAEQKRVAQGLAIANQVQADLERIKNTPPA